MVMEAAWPTLAERQGARAWLARRGVAVAEPTPLLAVRAGAREVATRSFSVFIVLSPMAYLAALLPPVPVPARFLVFTVVVTAYPTLRWRRVRRADRAAARLVPPGARPSFREVAGLVGRWYLAAVVTTFGGSAILCAAFAAHPAGWAAALVVGAASTAPVFARALRAPVIAEDEASRAVDAALRAYDVRVFATPSLFMLLVWIDVLAGWPPSPARWVPAAAYFALAMAVGAVAARESRAGNLPPGHYGTVTS